MACEHRAEGLAFKDENHSTKNVGAVAAPAAEKHNLTFRYHLLLIILVIKTQNEKAYYRQRSRRNGSWPTCQSTAARHDYDRSNTKSVVRVCEYSTFSYLTILVTKLRGLRSSEMGIRTLRTHTFGNTRSICSTQTTNPRPETRDTDVPRGRGSGRESGKVGARLAREVAHSQAAGGTSAVVESERESA